MEITGKIVQILPLQEGVSKAGNPWKKQQWILEFMSGQYPRQVCLQAFGSDKVDRMQMEIGKTYTVSFDPESREFNGRWYTDLNAWACREAADAMPGNSNFGPATAPGTAPIPGAAPAPAAPAAAYPGSDPFAAAPAMPAAEPTDDLPF